MQAIRAAVRRVLCAARTRRWAELSRHRSGHAHHRALIVRTGDLFIVPREDGRERIMTFVTRPFRPEECSCREQAVR